MKRVTVFLMISLVLAGVAGLVFAGGAPESSMDKDMDKGHMEKDAMDKGGDAMMMNADAAMEKPVFDMMGVGPAVKAYKDEKSAMMDAQAGTTVYFFAASWCPTCRAAWQDISANSKNFPMGFSLVVVNYDTAKDLKAKYGITYQHTFVQIDAMGKEVKKWSGSSTVADIVAMTTVM